MHFKLSETIGDGPLNYISLEDLYENKIEIKNAEFLPEPNFLNFETFENESFEEFFIEEYFENEPFEESIIEELPDPDMIVEPEHKDQNDQFFRQDRISFEQSRFPREEHVHLAEHPETHSAPLSEEPTSRSSSVKGSSSSSPRRDVALGSQVGHAGSAGHSRRRWPARERGRLARDCRPLLRLASLPRSGPTRFPLCGSTLSGQPLDHQEGEQSTPRGTSARTRSASYGSSTCREPELLAIVERLTLFRRTSLVSPSRMRRA